MPGGTPLISPSLTTAPTIFALATFVVSTVAFSSGLATVPVPSTLSVGSALIAAPCVISTGSAFAAATSIVPFSALISAFAASALVSAGFSGPAGISGVAASLA